MACHIRFASMFNLFSSSDDDSTKKNGNTEQKKNQNNDNKFVERMEELA
jgi:hypothetical protein